MRKTTLLKTMLLLCALIVGSGSVWGDTATLTNAEIVSAGDAASGYNTYAITGGGGKTWNVFAIKNYHSNATKDKYYLQLKKYANSTASYIQIPAYGTKITSITMTVSNTSQTMNGGGNTATLYFSASNTTSAAGTGVASGTGSSSVTINCASLNLNTGYITVSGGVRVWDVEVTYSTSSDPVPATGVTVKSSTTLTVGDTEQLTATVTPNDATDKVVSWESNTPSVATVDAEGNVSAVGLGTARITVTTHDGGYTADCDVTVVPVAATLDFTSNTGWEFPTDKTVGPHSYTNGYTVTLQGSTGQGYYFDTNNLLLGKNGAKLTLPAFPFKVNKIKVYGTSGASASVTFNVYVGDEAVSTSVTSSKVDHEFEIDAEKQDAGTVYVIKVTNDNNMRISKIKIFGYTSFTLASACTDGEKYYGTFSCNNAFVVPEGITVSALKIVDGKLSYMDYAKDDVVPASTGVLVSSITSGQKTVYLSDETGTTKVGNMLKPSGDAGIDAASMNIADTKFYRLTMHNGSTIGFWWGAESGAAFDLGANKAYLAVPETAAREGFSFENDVTGIKNLSRALSQGEGVAYNLAGQRVNANHKGLVIVNGKKYLNK